MLEAALIWDLPALGKFGPKTSLFRSTLQLHPGAVLLPKRAPAGDELLGRAAELFREYATGETVSYHSFSTPARESALGLLFADLWLAWLDDSNADRRQAVVERISRGGFSSNLRARSYVKLATWAWNQGNRDEAVTHFESAVKLARGELRRLLNDQARFFGLRYTIGGGPFKEDDLLYPWITEAASSGALEGLYAPIKARARGARTRTRTLGGTDFPGQRDIDSALVQAEWAGAFWLLPQLYRTKAALILGETPVKSRLAEGLALWALGGGERPADLIDAYEADFGRGTADEILVENLSEGRRLSNEETWVSICGVLWDQVSDEVAGKLISRVPLRDEYSANYPSGVNVEALSLYAVLYLRNRNRWVQRFEELSLVLRGLTLRCMSPALVRLLPDKVARNTLGSALSSESIEPQWREMGWDSIAAAVERLGAKKWKDRLIASIPGSAIPHIAMRYEGLLPDDLIVSRFQDALSLLERVKADMDKGTYSMYATDPVVSAVHLAMALNQPSEALVNLLIEQSIAERASTDQASMAVWGLSALLRKGLTSADVLTRASTDRPGSGPGLWDGPIEKRIEDARRAVLRIRLGTDPASELVALSRDPAVRVRQIAVEAALELAEQDASDETDLIMMGSLYDPEESVQTLASRGVVQGLVGSPEWSSVAWARVVEMWPAAHRNVRVAVMAELGDNPFSSPQAAELIELGKKDRSASVVFTARNRGRR